MIVTVSDLLSNLKEDQSQVFTAGGDHNYEYRFLEVAYNWEYGTCLSWENRPPFLEKPWLGSRVKPRIGLNNFEGSDLVYEGPKKALVDFYRTPSAAFVISDRLLDVFDMVDPGSLEVRRVEVQARDGRVPFNMVMPLRLIEAIDAGRCDVNCSAEQQGPRWLRRISFPRGGVIRNDIDTAIHNFAELDMCLWLWSIELFEKAKSAGVKGIVLRTPGVAASRQIDQI